MCWLIWLNCSKLFLNSVNDHLHAIVFVASTKVKELFWATNAIFNDGSAHLLEFIPMSILAIHFTPFLLVMYDILKKLENSGLSSYLSMASFVGFLANTSRCYCFGSSWCHKTFTQFAIHALGYCWYELFLLPWYFYLDYSAC